MSESKKVDKNGQNSDINYHFMIELIDYILKRMSVNNKEYFVKLSLLNTTKALQQASFVSYGSLVIFNAAQNYIIYGYLIFITS